MSGKASKHIHYVRHHGFSYPISLAQRLYSVFLGPLIIVGIMSLVMRYVVLNHQVEQVISFHELVYAVAQTLVRIIIAYVLALVVAIPLALLATSGTIAETIFLPIFDILESIPVLAFFPILVIIFININFLNGAAIFILFLSMLWNIVFTVVGGLKIIPKDITYAAQVFNVRGFSYFRKILLPAIFPQIVTGSILAVAQGWNLTIVAEVLHVYMPNGGSNQDLIGLGSLLVQAAANNQTHLFIIAVMTMVLIIAFINFFIWQKLLKYAQRFRFE